MTSANRDSAARLFSLALDRRASRSRLAASALIARASHAPARRSSEASMPRTGAGLAANPYRTSRAPPTLTAPAAGLARGPSTTAASERLAVLLWQSGPGLEPAPGVVPNVRRPRVERDLQTGRSVQGTN